MNQSQALDVVAAFFSQTLHCDVVPSSKINDDNYQMSYSRLAIKDATVRENVTFEKLYDTFLMKANCGDKEDEDSSEKKLVVAKPISM